MMSTVTNTQVAVKYRRNVGSLSIDMSADYRTTTLGRHIGRVSDDISPDARQICRPIYRVTYLHRHINWHSTDMSTDISVDTWRICWLICRSSVGRYVNRYVGQGVHKIHMIQFVYTGIHVQEEELDYAILLIILEHVWLWPILILNASDVFTVILVGQNMDN